MASIAEETRPATSFTTLVTGIVNDTEELIKQQVMLLKYDLRQDIRQTKEALTSLAVGGAIVAIGMVLFGFMCVHFISWLAPTWPLWVCYAIVACIVTAVGLAAVFAGFQRFRHLNLLPENSIQAMKENVQWTRANISENR
jgi:hypothetical protein